MFSHLDVQLLVGEQEYKLDIYLSITKNELISTFEAAKEALYLKQLLRYLGFTHEHLLLNPDNQRTIYLAKKISI